MNAPCSLCQPPAGDDLIFANAALRVVWAHEAGYPCFVRVVWRMHVLEMTDLSAADRTQLMQAVFAVEAAMRAVLKPQKINLASFGNRTPHLHWHVIPRWENDAHWPEPNWAAPQQAGVAYGAGQKAALAAAIHAALHAAPEHGAPELK